MHVQEKRWASFSAVAFDFKCRDMDFVGIIGIAAGIFTSLSLLPQLIKLIRNKKAEDLSIIYLITLFCGLALWIYYGVLREDLPIILTNVVSIIINGLIIILGIKYKKSLTD
jgi:MtN3 and saliva related transmembrane protein